MDLVDTVFDLFVQHAEISSRYDFGNKGDKVYDAFGLQGLTAEQLKSMSAFTGFSDGYCGRPDRTNPCRGTAREREDPLPDRAEIPRSGMIITGGARGVSHFTQQAVAEGLMTEQQRAEVMTTITGGDRGIYLEHYLLGQSLRGVE